MTKVLDDDYDPEVLMEMVEGFERWKDKTRHREFLMQQLKGIEGKVLDAAMGVGGDAIYLSKQGFRVEGTDKDEDAIRIVRQKVKQEEVKLTVECPHDWRELADYYEVGYFDAILCLGNSLTYLFDHNEQFKALANFKCILNDDGKLIIDERNYQHMFDFEGDIREGDFRYPGIYKFSEGDVQLVPVSIKKGEVKMRAHSRRTGNTLDMRFYPFKRNELLGLLREAGFRKIEQFSDYKPGFNPNADFYQYVCTK